MTGYTPLDCAAQEGRIDVIDILYEAMSEFSAEEKEAQLQKAVITACRTEKEFVVEHLLSLLKEFER